MNPHLHQCRKITPLFKTVNDERHVFEFMQATYIFPVRPVSPLEAINEESFNHGMTAGPGRILLQFAT